MKNQILSFDNLLEEVQNTTSKNRKSLTSVLYDAIDKAKGKVLSMNAITKVAFNYQFSHSRYFAHTKATNASEVLEVYNDLIKQADKAPKDKAIAKQVSDMFANIEKAKSRVPSAIKSALIRYEKRSTNVEHNTEAYPLTTKYDADKNTVSLVERA